ncbi:MAG: polymer-forming cytoskeletal protein [Alphaproteobacteria bacterium]|nr:polymer-forming cytoskeletal protein [Alphaproteobacteria bacterium]
MHHDEISCAYRQSAGLPDKPKPGWWPDDSAARANPGEDANLYVGRGLRLKGEVSSCDRLTVEGDVEATIAARVLEISSTGQV